MLKITHLKSKYIPLSKMASGRWKLHFGFEPYYEVDEEGKKTETQLGTWMETWLSGKPSIEQVKGVILDAINKEIDQKILSGFAWKGMPVWLSSENQFNYKAAYDLAFMSQGKSLPVVFKFGTTENPVYYSFGTLEDITDFYMSAMTYINSTLAEGWGKKDAIDWNIYESCLEQ